MRTLLNIKFFLRLAIVLLTVVVVAEVSFAQHGSINKKALKWYNRAQEEYKNKEYKKALQLLEQATKKEPQFIEGWLLKADVLTTTGNRSQAIEAYRRALKIDSVFFPPAWYLMGNLLMEEGDYPQAARAFQAVINNNRFSPALKLKAKKQLRWVHESIKLTKNPVPVTIKKINSSVNSPDDEFVNYVNATINKLIFTRKTKLPPSKNTMAAYREQFFESIKHDTLWQKPVILDLPWAKGRNVGAMSISADGKEIYFTGCRWPDGVGRCDLYKAHKKFNRWQFPANLGKTVNSTAWESQPFVSADGRYLLFSSTRPGGFGGSDIWMSVKLKNNQWSPPFNMGDSINTPGNEMAPFLYADNKTLIFSSDGYPGMGHQDLFITRKNKAGIWSKAENAGYPVNTKYNEINLIYSLDGKHAWISSNRENNNYDIYELTVYDKIKPDKILFFQGKVIDAQTGKPLSAKIILTDVTTGVNLSSRYSTGDDGTFLMTMEPRQTYAFNILAKGYLMLSDKFSPGKELTDSTNITKTFKLIPIKHGNKFTLNNLYFKVDSPQLNSKSFAELLKLIDFLKLNPTLKLEIRGHTDNTGGADYNLTLSRQRAKAVFDYLTAHGIDATRLSYTGYGFSQPVADNSTSEGKAKNRRVEMVVK